MNKADVKSMEIDGVLIDKDRQAIYPSYRWMDADGDVMSSDTYEVTGEDYLAAQAAVNLAMTQAVGALAAGETLDAFKVIEDVIYAGAVARFGLTL